jgi:hypothetical protein
MIAALALVCVLLAPPVPLASAAAAGDLRGSASWFATPGLTAAAGPGLRSWLGPGWRGETVLVCSDGCVQVRLTDWCQCSKGERRERLIDLSDGAFARIGTLSAGVIRVTISPTVAPPATDADG